MIIDSKLPNNKNFMTEMSLGKHGLKSAISDSAVSGMEQNNVALDLELDQGKKELEKKKKKEAKEKEKKRTAELSTPLSQEELKVTYLRKLTLI